MTTTKLNIMHTQKMKFLLLNSEQGTKHLQLAIDMFGEDKTIMHFVVMLLLVKPQSQHKIHDLKKC